MGRSNQQVRLPKVDSSFSLKWFEPRAWPRTFTRIMTLRIANLRVLHEKLHYATFWLLHEILHVYQKYM